MSTEPKRDNLDPQDSKHTGFVGLFETALRRFKRLVLGSVLVIVFLVIVCLLGISLTPSAVLVHQVFEWTEGDSLFYKAFFRAASVALGFLIYGMSVILVIPTANLLIRPFIKTFRGPYYSAGVFGWYIHNILTYVVRYTYLDLITPTPFNLFFYRAMGMKIGKRVEINTSNISDAAMITLEDGVTIGGSATIIAHYAMGGFLIITPVVIRKNATIGLRAVIMGGVEVGEGAVIMPNSVVLPKTIVPAGETWAGVPAQKWQRPANPVT